MSAPSLAVRATAMRAEGAVPDLRSYRPWISTMFGCAAAMVQIATGNWAVGKLLFVWGNAQLLARPWPDWAEATQTVTPWERRKS